MSLACGYPLGSYPPRAVLDVRVQGYIIQELLMTILVVIKAYTAIVSTTSVLLQSRCKRQQDIIWSYKSSLH